MKPLDHPHIIKIVESFQDRRAIYMVLQPCTGGELLDRIIDAGCFTEALAAVVMQQALSAVLYLHSRRICHRKIKADNFLFTTADPIQTACLKLIDFSGARDCGPETVLTTK